MINLNQLVQKWLINVGEMDPCSQYHHHFTSSYRTDFHSPKIQIQTVSTKKLRKTLSNKKAARKMLVKLTRGDIV